MENKYLSEYIGKQVDEAIRKTINIDSLATENSFNLIHSDGVWRSIKRFYDQLNQAINVIDGKVSGTISGITSNMVTDALGFTPYNSANFTKDNIKSTLGIADWALNSTKPSYSFSEITGVAAFNQLPTLYWANVALSDASNENAEPTFKSIKIGDGKITWDTNGYFVFDNGVVSMSFISAFGVSQGGSEEVSGVSSIKYNSQTFRADDGVIDISSIAIDGGVSSWNDLTDKPTWIGSSKPSYSFSEIGAKPTTISGYGITDAITAANIGSQSVANSTDASYLKVPRNSTTANVMPKKNGFSITEIDGSGGGSGTMPTTAWYHLYSAQGADTGYNTQLALGMTANGIWYRRYHNNVWQPWKAIAFTDSNVASATKLQTARTLWGNSFDGTANVRGNISVSRGDATDHSVVCTNTNGSIALLSSTNRGVYDNTKSGWLIATNGTNSWLPIGNVGIGTTAPTEKLDVNGKICAKAIAYQGTKAKYDMITFIDNAADNYGNGILIGGGGLSILGSGESAITIFNGLNTNGGSENTYIGADVNIYLYSGQQNGYDTTKCLVLTDSGNVGIGKTNPTQKLWVNGAISCAQGLNLLYGTYGSRLNFNYSNNLGYYSLLTHNNNNELAISATNDAGSAWTYDRVFRFTRGGTFIASGEVTAYSDKRLKTNIKGLDFRGALKPKSFIKDGKQSIGFIAQEVRELYPELVLGEETEDSYLALNYGAITAVLACQTNDHERRIAELERENKELKRKLNIN